MTDAASAITHIYFKANTLSKEIYLCDSMSILRWYLLINYEGKHLKLLVDIVIRMTTAKNNGHFFIVEYEIVEYMEIFYAPQEVPLGTIVSVGIQV